jgi:hypothetical protein
MDFTPARKHYKLLPLPAAAIRKDRKFSIKILLPSNLTPVFKVALTQTRKK